MLERAHRRIAVGLTGLICLLAAPAGAGAARTPRFARPATPAVGDDPSRIVAADLDGDGAADLATVDWTSATVSILRGKGDGNFARRVRHRIGRHPDDISVADLNGDGRLDLVTASQDRTGSVAVFLNGGAGRFARTGVYSTGPEAYAVATGDVNGDGLVDLVTAHYRAQHLAVLLGAGAGRFRAAVFSPGPRSSDVELADVNGDGRLDAVLAAGPRNVVAIRLGHGDGTFEPTRTYPTGAESEPFDITLADFNHDQRIDVAVANLEGANVSVFLGAGDGTLGARKDYDMGVLGIDAVVAADFDHDGNLDIASPSDVGPAVRRGRGDGTFGAERSLGDSGSQGGAVADFNGDGWADVAFNAICDEEDCPVDWALVYLNWSGQPAPPCVVPDVRSDRHAAMSLSRASRVLRHAGCRLGRVSHRGSRRSRRGLVIAQRRRPNIVLPSRTRVGLVVSRGRRR